VLVWTGRSDGQAVRDEFSPYFEDPVEAAWCAGLDDDHGVGGLGCGGDESVAGRFGEFVEHVGDRDQVDATIWRPAAEIGCGPVLVAMSNEAAAELDGGWLSLHDLSRNGGPQAGGGPGGGSGAAAEIQVGAEGSVRGEQSGTDRVVGGRHAEDGVREAVEFVRHAERGVVDLLGAVAGGHGGDASAQGVVLDAVERPVEGSMKLCVHGGQLRFGRYVQDPRPTPRRTNRSGASLSCSRPHQSTSGGTKLSNQRQPARRGWHGTG